MLFLPPHPPLSFVFRTLVPQRASCRKREADVTGTRCLSRPLPRPLQETDGRTQPKKEKSQRLGPPNTARMTKKRSQSHPQAWDFRSLRGRRRAARSPRQPKASGPALQNRCPLPQLAPRCTRPCAAPKEHAHAPAPSTQLPPTPPGSRAQVGRHGHDTLPHLQEAGVPGRWEDCSEPDPYLSQRPCVGGLC